MNRGLAARTAHRGDVVFAAICALAVLAGCGTSATTSAANGSTALSSGKSAKLTLALGSSFEDGTFKRASTCQDPDMDYSPSLSFAGTRKSRTLAITMVDLANGKVHWILTGLDGAATGIVEHTLAPGAKEWPNDFNEASYDGPCPPAHATHRYALTLYSLTAPVDLSSAKKPLDAVAKLAAAANDRVEVVATYTAT